jgi:hypothetical protein
MGSTHDRLSIATTSHDSTRATRDRPTRPNTPPGNLPYAHRSLSPMNEFRREVSLTSVVVDVQNPSAESLPISPSATNPITVEPLAMESATAHSSSDSPVVGQHEEPVPGLPTSSSTATLDYYLPEGRFVQLINSDQIPRYAKDVSTQVEYTILLPHPYISADLAWRYLLM